MESGGKLILTIVLIISAGLVLYPQINTYLQTPDSDLTNNAKNQLAEQIMGFSMLFCVALCVSWAIPETELEKERNFQKQQTEEKRRFQKQTDEMLEKGYVLNIETGKWEKPIEASEKNE